MMIVLIGLNHRTAPVELREKLALDGCDPGAAYQDIRRPGISESLFLSTCNRVEVLALADSFEAGVKGIQGFFAEPRGLDPNLLTPHLYVYSGPDAVRHLFSVASSLDSMVVGEPQILGQLKDAFRRAVDYKATGPILNKLLHKSFSVAKRVRTETGIASHAVSIGYAAAGLARKIFGDLAGHKVLLIGAGEMAELTAEHLLGHGASEITVCNRTLARAVDLAARFGGRAASLEELPSLLVPADIVISSTGSPDLVVTREMVKSILKARRHRALFFVDIAVPRDVDPAVNRLDNVYLYDIDDLGAVVDENRAARAQEAIRAKRIVEEETLGFLRWLDQLEAFPTITALCHKADRIREAEVKKTLARLGPLSPGQIQAIETMARSLTRKMLHDPIQFIKTAGNHGRKDLNLDLCRRVLGLDPDQRAAETALDEAESDEMASAGECALGPGQPLNASAAKIDPKRGHLI